MKSLLKVKYIETNSQDGYQYIEFDMYSSFAKWFIKNRKTIEILDIEQGYWYTILRYYVTIRTM